MEPLVPALNLAAYSMRPDLVYPEAVELGMGLVVVTAVEVRDEKVMELVDWMRRQEPVLLYCEADAPPEVHERVARDRLRQAEAIEMIRLALE